MVDWHNANVDRLWGCRVRGGRWRPTAAGGAVPGTLGAGSLAEADTCQPFESGAARVPTDSAKSPLRVSIPATPGVAVATAAVWVGENGSTGFQLSDSAIDWTEEVANGEAPDRSAEADRARQNSRSSCHPRLLNEPQRSDSGLGPHRFETVGPVQPVTLGVCLPPYGPVECRCIATG